MAVLAIIHCQILTVWGKVLKDATKIIKQKRLKGEGDQQTRNSDVHNLSI